MTVKNSILIVFFILYSYKAHTQLLGGRMISRKPERQALVYLNTFGKLVYKPDAKGNIVPDFSGVGYRNSEAPIPSVPVVKTVVAVNGDNLSNIQNAINEVATYPLAANGFRGAILFKAGTYNVSDAISISTNGIVLRGEGFNGSGTNFIATKTSQHDFIKFSGSTSLSGNSNTIRSITDNYVPIGSKHITVASGHNFVVGDNVLLRKIPNDAWISLLGMNTLASPSNPGVINWTASSYILDYQRKVLAVNGNIITIDAPVMDVIDINYGSGQLMKYNDPRIQNCGIENLRITSVYSSQTDENHGWNAITFRNIKNAWARNIEVFYFGYSAVSIATSASWITVDSCKMLDPISIITGGRRYSFNVDGQRNLVQNCVTRRGRHDYVTGARVCGPNVFHNSSSTLQNSDIGPHHRWATGILFDKITGNGEINVQNRRTSGTGHGWAGSQIMFWNCKASKIKVQDPPGDHRNWAIGCIAPTITNVGNYVTEPLGYVESQGVNIVSIPSLFQAQLLERLSGL